MTRTRYTVTTKGSRTIVHRLGKVVGPIVRGTSFRRPGDAERATRSMKKRSPKSDD